MTIPPAVPIRPAALLAGSVLTLIVGLALVAGGQGPSAVPAAGSPADGAAEGTTGAGPASSAPVSPGAESPALNRPRVPRTTASLPRASTPPLPLRLTVGAIGLDLAVRPVGTTADRLMELPDDPAVLGWYRFGAAPGSARGSAVLAGHVDSSRYGIGPLADLDRLRPGDRLEVTTTAGRRGYRVDRTEYRRRSRLPASELFDRAGPPRLVVITCGGPYDPRSGYRDNLIVTASPDPAIGR